MNDTDGSGKFGCQLKCRRCPVETDLEGGGQAGRPTGWRLAAMSAGAFLLPLILAMAGAAVGQAAWSSAGAGAAVGLAAGLALAIGVQALRRALQGRQ